MSEQKLWLIEVLLTAGSDRSKESRIVSVQQSAYVPITTVRAALRG